VRKVVAQLGDERAIGIAKAGKANAALSAGNDQPAQRGIDDRVGYLG